MTLQELCAELQGLANAFEAGDLTWDEYKLACAEMEQAYCSEHVSPAEY